MLIKLKHSAWLLLFAATMVLSGCTREAKKDDATFKKLYAEFQANNHVEYDSLLSFYHRLDSASDVQRPELLEFLKKTTEARLQFREAAYEKSNQKYQEAIRLLPTGMDSLKALNYMGMGINFTNMGTYDSAFSYYNKATALYEKSNNKRMVDVVASNRALAYYNKREPEKAMELIAHLAANSPDTNILLTVLHLKANILGSEGKLDSAMALDRALLKRFSGEQDNYKLSSIFNNLGLCFLEKGHLDSALYYCRKSYRMDSLSGIEMNMGANLVLMGDICSRGNDRKQAQNYYHQALKIFSEDRNLDKKYWVFEILAKSARQEKDLNALVLYQDSMLSVFGRMNSLNVNRTIELLNIEYETDQKNHQINLQHAQLNTQRMVIGLTSAVFLLVLAVLYFVFQNRDKRQRLRIAEQESRVSGMLMEAEQNERSRIARDLHDSVNQKLAVMQMHLSTIETQQTEALGHASEMLQQAISDVRGISHNLYPKDLEKGILPALEHVCEQNNFVNPETKFRLLVDESVRSSHLSKNIQLVIYRIVQEITNNALKHSKASEVTIELAIRNDTIALQISDNGVGFDASRLEQAKGIGLKTMMDRIRQINGNITFQSQETVGTRYFIELPA